MTGRANAALLGILLAASPDVQARLRRDEGQAFVEYALLLVIVAVAIGLTMVLTSFRSMAEGAFSTVVTAVTGAGQG